ncbi:DUF4124 domain-containing protein [Nitrosococcus watsonii]|uniref:DUF4124 domain-containing protein n=1 Tax=Nitrosococcus watsoni (strain C-113) TaxID=105559 RepID=D8KC71_NITWC|nr:DUF4124 domain-containing protein [Nitrosococcus watsonii]ADJ29742.1 conserved hypothetical protein [Nitrosococcus watsonii C-113]
MNKSLYLIITIILFLLFLERPAFAGSVHKWIDDNGVTHYSDEAPSSSATQVTLIQVPSSYPAVEDNYYSIANQWQRLYKKHIQREKIKLKKAKQKAAQQPPSPQVVYVSTPDQPQYGTVYPSIFHRSLKHHKFQHRLGRHHKGNHGTHHRKKHAYRLIPGDGHDSPSHRKAGGLILKAD